MTGRLGATSVVAGVVLLGLFARGTVAVAHGGGVASGSDATIASTTMPAAQGRVRSGIASCPAGQRAVGGGVGQIGTLDPAQFLVMESGPLGDAGTTAGTNEGDVARSWFASAVEARGGSDSNEVRVFAICSTTSDATIEVASFSVDPMSVGSGAATCRDGRRATGGGIGQAGALDALFTVLQSGPLDSSSTTVGTAGGNAAVSWFAAVSNLGQSARVFKVFALCSSSSDATIVKARTAVDRNAVAPLRAGCPSGKRAVDGGVGQEGPIDSTFGFVEASGPLDDGGTTVGTESGDVARSWLAVVANVGGPREYDVFALCATEASKPPLSVNGFSVGKARAGHDFVVSFVVRSGGKGAKGTLSCTARLDGGRLAAARRSIASGGRASCTWSLPRSSHGRRLKGSISETFDGVKISRGFSVRVAS